MRLFLAIIVLVTLAIPALADDKRVIIREDNSSAWSRATIRALDLDDDRGRVRVYSPDGNDYSNYRRNYNYNGYGGGPVNPERAQVQSICGDLRERKNKYRRCTEDVREEQQKLIEKYRD